MNNKRISGKAVNIESGSIRNFFKKRADGYSNNNPLSAVLYQDNNPQVAIDRDMKEKEKLLPLLDLNKQDKVLDLGCGIGRWAETIAPLVYKYHGIDLMPDFIQIATENCKGFENTTFQVLSAQEISPTNIIGTFNVILISGLLIYLNDEEVKQLFKILNCYIEESCRVLIREPIGINERLTLNEVWSEELMCEYSAIYRTQCELLDLVEHELFNSKLLKSGYLFEDKLNNRVDTKQYYFLFRVSSDE